MNIATLIHTHGNPEITWDTVESVKTYMTHQILVLVDGLGWDKFEKQGEMLKGFDHGYHKAPYKNVILGLINIQERWPEADWYVYLEYDCLIGSSFFIKDLDESWIVATDYRQKEKANLSFVEHVLGDKFKEVVYVLGAVMFLKGEFIRKSVLFFKDFLAKTVGFKVGYLPDYKDHDIIEHLLPTLAKHWGGGIKGLSSWNGTWHNDFRHYPVRWKPDLRFVEHEYMDGSIMHPIKEMSDIRYYHKIKRKQKLL